MEVLVNFRCLPRIALLKIHAARERLSRAFIMDALKSQRNLLREKPHQNKTAITFASTFEKVIYFLIDGNLQTNLVSFFRSRSVPIDHVSP